MEVSRCFLVGIDISKDDNVVLIVGEKKNKVDVEVINAFQGEEALELYKKLTEKKTQ